MKFLIVLLSFFLFSVSYAMNTDGYDTVTLSNSQEIPTPFCPVTKFSDNDKCLDCHVLKMVEGKAKFGLKEIPVDAGYNLPHGTSIIAYSEDKLALYYENNGTASGKIREISQYMQKHPEFTRFVMEIFSPGGSVMDAWRAVGIIEEMRRGGIEIETRCYGMAASAGTILLVAGDIGKRFVNWHAEIMLHKLWTFAMFKLDDPDTAEDQAALMKHLQENINSFFISRTSLSKEVLDKNMFKKDWWVTGKQAVALGIADGMLK